MLDNVNLIHMNGRVYDPLIGRFLSPDPLSGTVGQSQSWNPYSYVMNQPLSLSDPSGYASDDTPPPKLPDDGGGSGTASGGGGGGAASDGWGTQGWDESQISVDANGVETLPPYGVEVSGAGSTPVVADSMTLPAPVYGGGTTNVAQNPGGGGGKGSGGKGVSEPPKSQTTQGGPDQLETVTVTASKCSASSSGGLADQVSDAVVGFGDAFLIPILVRGALGIDGTVHYGSSAYTGGMIGGTVWGLVPFALEGAASYSATQAARGTPSILNANRYFRTGPGRWTDGSMRPRISSPYLPGDGHVDLSTRLPTIPPLGALTTSSGC